MACRRFHYQAEWNHHQSRVAKGVPYEQELCLASGGPPAQYRISLQFEVFELEGNDVCVSRL